MLSFDKDINLASGTYTAACSTPTAIHTTNSVPEYRQYDWNGKQLNTTLTILSNPAGICLATAASAVIISSGVTTLDVVNVNTNQRTNITGAALCFTSGVGQQVATDGNGIVYYTKTGTGSLTKFNATTQTVTSVSPSSLSGIGCSCIIYKADTQTFLLGTNGGKIIEINSAGNPLKTINLPNSPNVSAPTITVTGLSYFGDTLVCITGHGIQYFYKYSTSAIQWINTFGTRGSSNPATSCLSDAASGTFIISHGGGQPAASTSGLTETFMASGNNPSYKTVFSESSCTFQAAQIEPTLNKVWAHTANSNSQGVQLRLFTITALQPTTETTRGQDPIGIDVAHRLIRIRDEGVGRASIELDQNVASGTQTLPCTDGHNYIEYSRQSSKWDVREFKA